MILTPDVPGYLLSPLPAPQADIDTNRDVLDLLADYEALRRRANADRVGIAEILRQMDDEDK
ncbi:hypothetical protein [Halomonas sp. WWR20]